MNTTLGNILTNSKSSLSVEVLNNGKLIGTHKFDKSRATHSFTEESTLSDEIIYGIFEQTKPLVDRLRKGM